MYKRQALYDYNKKELFDLKKEGTTISFVDSFSIIWGEHSGKLNIVNNSKFEMLFPTDGGIGKSAPIVYDIISFNGKNLIIESTSISAFFENEVLIKKSKYKVRYLWNLKE